jgi:hypothetical protein
MGSFPGKDKVFLILDDTKNYPVVMATVLDAQPLFHNSAKFHW